VWKAARGGTRAGRGQFASVGVRGGEQADFSAPRSGKIRAACTGLWPRWLRRETRLDGAASSTASSGFSGRRRLPRVGDNPRRGGERSGDSKNPMRANRTTKGYRVLANCFRVWGHPPNRRPSSGLISPVVSRSSWHRARATGLGRPIVLSVNGSLWVPNFASNSGLRFANTATRC